jgi:hypothetical protein
MAVTPNFSWPVPVATDYVKDGWEAISDLGNAIDTTVAGLGSAGFSLVSSTTITAQSTVQISNVFTATYRNYKIIADFPTVSAGGTLTFQFTSSGTASTVNYQMMGTGLTSAGTTSNYNSSGGSSAFLLQYNSSYPCHGFTLDLLAPQIAQKTVGLLQTAYVSSIADPTARTIGLLHEVATSYDGIKLTASAGNVTGTLKIYGYQN